MGSKKTMTIIYTIAALLCGGLCIFKLIQGNISNGILWLLASFCWGTCIFNIKNQNNLKK